MDHAPPPSPHCSMTATGRSPTTNAPSSPASFAGFGRTGNRMLAPQPIAFLAPADSAQAVATVYTASLLVVAPLCIAAIAGFMLRRGTAEARVLVWRSAPAAWLLICIGRQLPLQWVAWVVPSALAT